MANEWPLQPSSSFKVNQELLMKKHIVIHFHAYLWTNRPRLTRQVCTSVFFRTVHHLSAHFKLVPDAVFHNYSHFSGQQTKHSSRVYKTQLRHSYATKITQFKQVYCFSYFVHQIQDHTWCCLRVQVWGDTASETALLYYLSWNQSWNQSMPVQWWR